MEKTFYAVSIDEQEVKEIKELGTYTEAIDFARSALQEACDAAEPRVLKCATRKQLLRDYLVELTGDIIAVMDTFGSYYAIPFPKAPPLEGTGVLTSAGRNVIGNTAPIEVNMRFDLLSGAAMSTAYDDGSPAGIPVLFTITLPKPLQRHTDNFYLPAGCNVSFRADPAAIEQNFTVMSGMNFDTPMTVKLPNSIFLDNYHLPILEGYAMCDIDGISTQRPVAFRLPNGDPTYGYTIQLKDNIIFNRVNCLLAEPTIVNEGNVIVAGTPVICQWDTEQGVWLITQAGCGPVNGRNYDDYAQHLNEDGFPFASRNDYLEHLTQELWEAGWLE